MKALIKPITKAPDVGDFEVKVLWGLPGYIRHSVGMPPKRGPAIQ